MQELAGRGEHIAGPGDKQPYAATFEAERVFDLGDYLHLNNRELAFLVGVNENSLHRWRKQRHLGRLAAARVLIDMGERAIARGKLDRERVQHYMGLAWTPARGVHRPRGDLRTDKQRTLTWAYIARCAFSEDDFRQLGLPLDRKKTRRRKGR